MSDNGTPNTLSEVMSKDLAGFQLVKAYNAELKHGLMGFFPAIFKDNDDIVVCIDVNLLKKVCELLTPRKMKISGFLALVNIEQRFGFDIRNDNEEKTKPLHILTEEEFTRRTTAEEEPFRWTPGLIGPDMTSEEFAETLDEALKQHGIVQS
ncbi:hypothetical protein ACFL3E_00020 [Patescibacteria group bacterium]